MKRFRSFGGAIGEMSFSVVIFPLVNSRSCIENPYQYKKGLLFLKLFVGLIYLNPDNRFKGPLKFPLLTLDLLFLWNLFHSPE
jgi:hypothetical protein